MPEFYTNVHISTDEMIDILEQEGYKILHKDEANEANEEYEELVDKVHNLYKDFLDVNVYLFERKLMQFFSEALDVNVVRIK